MATTSPNLPDTTPKNAAPLVPKGTPLAPVLTDIISFLRVILLYSPLIILITVIGTLAAWFYAERLPKEYVSETTVMIGVSGSEATRTDASVYNVLDPNIVGNYVAIMKTRRITEPAEAGLRFTSADGEAETDEDVAVDLTATEEILIVTQEATVVTEEAPVATQEMSMTAEAPGATQEVLDITATDEAGALIEPTATPVTRRYRQRLLNRADVEVVPISNSTLIEISVRSTDKQLAQDLANATALSAIANMPPSLAVPFPLELLYEANLPANPVAPNVRQLQIFGGAGSFVVGIVLVFLIDAYRQYQRRRKAA
ncbi:MAG: hypothetical protein H7Y11_14035 [Armatimonadetes bacterium]|nr:hypothetical protein [Anaerolineae bacterium]